MERITIIGLGLIGGSIGLALKQARGNGIEIVGHDLNPEAAAKAMVLGAIDKTARTLASATEKADLILIATPVMAIKQILSQIAPSLPGGCIITDTASTKEQVIQWAQEFLPSTVSFIGGHPVAGKETSGIDGAEAHLFTGCTYCLIPGPNVTQQASEELVELVNLIGAKPFFIDAARHDEFVAAISHLPILLSAALVSATTKSPSWPDFSKLAATGFRDLSRLASGNPEVNRDICLTNQAAIVRWIDAYINQLQAYRRLIIDGSEELGKAFAQAREARQKWLHEA